MTTRPVLSNDLAERLLTRWGIDPTTVRSCRLELEPDHVAALTLELVLTSDQAGEVTELLAEYELHELVGERVSYGTSHLELTVTFASCPAEVARQIHAAALELLADYELSIDDVHAELRPVAQRVPSVVRLELEILRPLPRDVALEIAGVLARFARGRGLGCTVGTSAPGTPFIGERSLAGEVRDELEREP
jgi:hypothetical protein